VKGEKKITLNRDVGHGDEVSDAGDKAKAGGRRPSDCR